MSNIGDKLNTFKTTFAAANLSRTVDRSYVELGDRDESVYNAGVWQILNKNMTNINAPVDMTLLEGDLEFVLNGQILLSESATGEDVEEVELTLLDEVWDFLKSKPAGLCSIDIKEFHQSMQVDRPYGWVFILLQWSDFD